MHSEFGQSKKSLSPLTGPLADRPTARRHIAAYRQETDADIHIGGVKFGSAVSRDDGCGKRADTVIRSMTIALAAVGLVAAPLAAQTRVNDDTKVAVSPGKAIYTSRLRNDATVKMIDYKTRKFSLLTASGQTVSGTAGPEIKSFKQIKVGDKVVSTYEETIELTLVKGAKEPVGTHETNADERSAAGEAPGVKTTTRTMLTANVIKVDKKKGVVTLQGATEKMDLTIKDPAQLKLVKAGDQVHALVTTSLALSLEPAKKQ